MPIDGEPYASPAGRNKGVEEGKGGESSGGTAPQGDRVNLPGARGRRRGSHQNLIGPEGGRNPGGNARGGGQRRLILGNAAIVKNSPGRKVELNSLGERKKAHTEEGDASRSFSRAGRSPWKNSAQTKPQILFG